MKIAQDAVKPIITCGIFFVISTLLAQKIPQLYALSTLSIIILLFLLYFFRDPNRNTKFSENEISAPGDGKIISISDEGNVDKIIIRIFLSIFDVHIQRSPVSGTVKEITFFPGKFHIAYKHNAKENQRNLIKIIASNGKELWVEQITGAIARRIACYVKEGQEIENGQKIGMIYLGSQVALYLPKDAKIKVKVGDKIKAGIDVIATW